MNRKAIASFLLTVLFLVSVFAMNISTGAIDSANDLRFTRERTSLNNERIGRQAKIVEHRITTSELEKMKREIGVYEKGRDYNQIINGHGTGLRPLTEEEWAQIAAEANVVETISLLGSEPVPSRVDWSTSPWFPPIGDQDGEFSCVSWAVGYYMKTFQEAKEHEWNLSMASWEGGYYGYPTPAYQDKIISPAFIYHLTNFGLNGPTWTPDAINLVCSIGSCSWAEMPWNSSDQSTWPSENAWREASYYRGASTGYEELFVDTVDGILSLKNLIASENLAVIRVDASQFSSLTSEDVWTVDNYLGGHNHVNTIVGYDDNMTYLEDGNWSKGAFKIANSFGVGGWENVPDGCYWISYKAMSQRVGSVMFYRDRIGYVPALTCSFRIEHPVRGDCATIAIGMGTHDNPDVLKITDYICGGNFSFCPNNIVLDITEFMDAVPNVYGQPFFIRVFDRGIYDPLGGTPATGTILYFAVENIVSSNPPVATVNDGYVFADLILTRYVVAYVSNADASNVSVIDLTTNTVLTTINIYQPVPPSPDPLSNDIKIMNNKCFLSVPGSGASPINQMKIINTTSNTVVKTLSTSIPSGFDEYGGKLYLLSYVNTHPQFGLVVICEIDPVLETIVRYITFIFLLSGSNPPIFLEIQDDKIYLPFPGRGASPGAIKILNLTDGSLIASFNTPPDYAGSYYGPLSIKTISEDKIYLGMYSQVFVLDTATNTIVKQIPLGHVAYANAMALVSTKVYVTLDDGWVAVIDSVTDTLLGTIDLGYHGDPYRTDIAVSGDRVYVTDSPNKDIKIIDALTDSIVGTINTGEYSVAIDITTPDVAITNVKPSKTVIGQGYNLNINVTVANQGDYTETFNLNLYANATLIKAKAVILTSGNSTTVTFICNTSGFVKGNYTISVVAHQVLGETDTADNRKEDGWVLITRVGDIDGDGDVDYQDDRIFGWAYIAYGQTGEVDARCDFNDDGKVNYLDDRIFGWAYVEYGKNP
jgi:hypothetical protein